MDELGLAEADGPLADDALMTTPGELALLHGYGEAFSALLVCYSLEEIVAEKVRALLQTRRHLDERGWAAARSRDYYDPWDLLCSRRPRLDRALVGTLLPQKCCVRGVSFESVNDFFHEGVVDRAGIDWMRNLRRVAPGAPDFDVCLAELRPEVATMVERM